MNHTYHHTSVRRSKTSIELQRNTRRNDYGSRNPDQSFTRRNEGAKNKEELRSRNTGSTEVKRNNASPASTGKKIREGWKPESEKRGEKSPVKGNKVTVEPDRSVSKYPG